MYADLHKLTENQRIDMIGKAALNTAPGRHVAFVVESMDKAERYIKKLKAKFPGITIQEPIKDVPLPGMITVKAGCVMQ